MPFASLSALLALYSARHSFAVLPFLAGTLEPAAGFCAGAEAGVGAVAEARHWAT